MQSEMLAKPIQASGEKLVISGLSKQFGGIRVLKDVNFTVNGGEIHALLGANGAGKSTLIKILAGIYTMDGGHISTPGAASGNAFDTTRFSFVHQDLGLIDSMSVAENMAMGYGYPRRMNLIDWRAVRREAAKALEQLGAPLPLDKLVGELSQAERAIVAIARAVSRDIDVIVLDEPTARLPEADVSRLIETLKRLRDHNVGIVYVTHRLDEVFRLADAATVLRDGEVVASYRPLSVPPDQLITDICGKVPTKRSQAAKLRQTATVMEVSNLCVDHIGPVSFSVGTGEILGLAGLRGQGHEAVGRAIAGFCSPSGGSVSVDNQLVPFTGPQAAIKAGVGFASSRRVEECLSTTMNVRENLFLNPGNFGRSTLNFMSRSAERDKANEILSSFDVKPRDPEREIMTLSGGNQQKVVLARLVGQEYRILVLEEPTMGVDIGAKSEIYRILANGAAKGVSCVIISSDLDELVQICDRVLAFAGGKVVSEIQREDLSVELLTREISGASEAARV